MSALCILLEVKPEKVTKDDGKKVDDYWPPAKKEVLGDTKLLNRLKSFDKDNISEQTLRRLGPFIKKKEFTPEEVKKASAACSGICQWIRAVNAYAKSKPKAEATTAKAKEEKPAAKEKAKKEPKAKTPQVPAAEAGALQEAEKALKGVKGAALKELKAMTSPPEAVKVTMSALCVLLDEKPVKVTTEDDKKVDDYWEPAQKVLGDTKMISNLVKLDKDSISEQTLRRLGPFIKKKAFDPEEVKKASAACETICLWIRAVNAYAKAKAKAPKDEKPAAKEKAKKAKEKAPKKEKEKTPKEPKPPKVFEIPEWEVTPGKQRGVVSRFFGRKGFGFIQMAAGGDIFVHLSALGEG